MEKQEAAQQTSRSVERALSILEQFIERDALGVTELSKLTGLGKSTVHLQLKALEKRGYIVQDELTGVYSLGTKILQLAGGMLRNQQLTKIAEPILRVLTKDIHETATLSIPDGTHVLYVLNVENMNSPWNIQSVVRVGARAPMHCTGSGKAMLAFSPKERIREVMEVGLSRMTDKTITDPEKFLSELEKVRQQGYAFNDEEFESGLRSVAVPIFNFQGDMVAAIHVSIPSVRFALEKVEFYGERLKQVAEEISGKLGHYVRSSS